MANETFNKAIKQKEDAEYDAFLKSKMQELKSQGYIGDEEDAVAPSKTKPVSNANPTAKTEEPGVIKSVAKGVAGGVWSAIGNVAKSAEDLTVWANNKLGGNWQSVEPLNKAADFSKFVGEWYKDEGSQVNKATHLITENLVGFIPALKGINMLKATTAGAKVAQATNAALGAGKVAKTASVATAGLGAGTVASVTTVTPETETFANMAKGWGIDNEIVDFLAVDAENDSRAEMRLKQALDSALFGVVANGAIEGIAKGFRGLKDWHIARGTQPEEIAKEFQAVRDGAKEVTDTTIQAEEKEQLKATLQVASPEDKNLIKQITSKENPTEEELKTLNEVIEANAEKVVANESSNTLVVANKGVQEVEGQVAKEGAEQVIDEAAIVSKLDEIKANPEAVEQVFEIAKRNGVEASEELKAEIKNTINNTDSKEAAKVINEVLNSKAGNEVKRSLLSNLFGTGAGATAGYNTIDEDDGIVEKIFKVTSGAALGTMAVRYAKGKLTPNQFKVFEESNPTVAAVSKNESVVKDTAKAGKPMPDMSNPAVQAELNNLRNNIANRNFEKLTSQDFEKVGVMQNIRKIESAEDVEKVLLQSFNDLDGTVKAAKVGAVGNEATGVRKWAEAKAASKSFRNIKSVEDLFNNTYLLDAQALGARQTLAASALDVKRILGEMEEIYVKAGTTNIRNNAEFKVKLIEYANATERHAGLSAMVFGSSSEMGRALNIHKMIIKDEAALKMDMDNILNNLGGMKDIVAKANAMRNLTDPADITRAIKFSKMPLIDAAFFVRTAGLLSNPFTHLTNIVGNITKQAVSTVENYTKAGFASINNDLFKSASKVEYSKADADAYLFGLISGVKDAGNYLTGSISESFNSVVRKIPKQEKEAGVNFYNTVAGNKNWELDEAATSIGDSGFLRANPIGTLAANTTDVIRSKIAKEFDPDGNLELAGQWIGSVIGLPFRALGSADKFFNALSHRASLSEQAFRKAKAEGLTGDAFNQRVASLIKEPTEDMVVIAEKKALDDTYQTPLDKTEGKSVVDEMANIIQNAKMTNKNGAVNFMANVTFPFVKTPTNILKQSLVRVPGLNLLAERFEENSIKAVMGQMGKEKQAEAVARFTTGVVLLSAGYQFHDNGIKITNNGRNVVIDWGGKTTDLAKIEPIGTILGLSAKVHEALNKTAALREVDPEAANNIVYDVTTTALMTIYQYTGNKTYMKGFFDLMEVGKATMTGNTQQSADAFDKWINNTASSFLPYGSALNWGRNVTDDSARVADGFIEKIMNKIPMVSKELEPRLDIVTGDPLLSDSTTGAFKKEVENPLLDEIRRLEVTLPKITKVQGVKLDEKSLTRLVEIATKETTVEGMTLQEYLSEKMHSDEYQQMEDGIGEYLNADGTKSGFVHDVISGFYAMAKDQLMEENDKLKDDKAIKEMKKHSYITGEQFLRDAQDN